ncbi:hypothetical protein WJX81_008274 [Elliptochloris bilobata]|uniref:Coilin n=1 Tax=Elliptochloris bilobata TaxID=381761 RepID=A0AAW1RWK2_9CHLO
MEGSGVRLRVEVGDGLESPVLEAIGRRIWWQPSADAASVADLATLVARDLGLGSGTALRLSIGGYALPPAGPATLAVASVAGWTPMLTLTLRPQADQSSSSSSEEEASSSASEEAASSSLSGDTSEEELRSKGAGNGAHGPAPASGRTPTPASLPAGGPTAARAAPAAAKQTPSRSARRKKLKRQLRAQGLLAPRPAASTRPAALHAAATAPALNPHANGGPAPYRPPVLVMPRRGEARALDPREAEFLERGDLVAYRLLHVGPDWAPTVSPWRLGRVRALQESVDTPACSGGVGLVMVEPWPAAYHAQCALLCGGGWEHRVERGTPWRAERGGHGGEEQEIEGGPPTDYDAAGAPGQPAQRPSLAAGAPAAGDAPPGLAAWAALAEELRRRRSGPAIGGGTGKGPAPVGTPGATKPRPGVRQASLGAFLSRLRSEGAS